MKTFLKPISLCLLIGLLLGLPMRAAAHALDEYLQAIYITLTPKRVMLEMDLTPALLVAPQVLAGLDANHDEQISEAEGTAFANAFLKDIVVVVDDQPLSVTLVTSQFPTWLNLNSGVGTIRLDGVVDVPTSAATNHTLVVQNKHQPVKSSYLINALLPNKDEIRITQQSRDEQKHGLQVIYDVVGSAADASPIIPQTNAGAAQQLITYLSMPTLTPALIALAIGLAIVLGGLHALTPGHGKTLVAAYLVGSRGTVQHAVFLGSIVTFTHTVSVIVVGLLALMAQQVIAPGLLVSVLEIGSGLLVVGMGVQLVLARWRALRSGDASEHNHGFGAHTHTGDAGAGNSDHRHLSRGGLLAMGVSGGLVPCPEALGIMLVAIGLNRIALGLGLIIAFSAGLALVLILMGVLLVRSKSLADRFGKLNAPLYQALPLVGAIIVTILGAGLIIKGLLAPIL